MRDSNLGDDDCMGTMRIFPSCIRQNQIHGMFFFAEGVVLTSLSAMLISSSLVSNHISVARPTRTRSCSFVIELLLVACAIRSPEGVKRMAVCILDGERTSINMVRMSLQHPATQKHETYLKISLF